MDKDLHRGIHYIDIPELIKRCTTGYNLFSRQRFKINKRKLQILQRDNFRCTICGTKNYLTIDHLRLQIKNPQKNKRYTSKELHRKASTYVLGNCQTLCVDCHLRKNTKE